MARQGVTAGNEMKLSKGKLRPNNRSKFLTNEISRSQTTSRLESWTGTAEPQGGHFSTPQRRAARPSTASTAPRALRGPDVESLHKPGAGCAWHCMQHPRISCITETPSFHQQVPQVPVPACKLESWRARHFFKPFSRALCS